MRNHVLRRSQTGKFGRAVLLGLGALTAGVLGVKSMGPSSQDPQAIADRDENGTASTSSLLEVSSPNELCEGDLGARLEFKDRGDVFTVHDECKDGLKARAEICEQDNPTRCGTVGNDGGSGSAERNSIDIKEGRFYIATLYLTEDAKVDTGLFSHDLAERLIDE